MTFLVFLLFAALAALAMSWHQDRPVLGVNPGRVGSWPTFIILAFLALSPWGTVYEAGQVAGVVLVAAAFSIGLLNVQHMAGAEWFSNLVGIKGKWGWLEDGVQESFRYTFVTLSVALVMSLEHSLGVQMAGWWWFALTGLLAGPVYLAWEAVSDDSTHPIEFDMTMAGLLTGLLTLV